MRQLFAAHVDQLNKKTQAFLAESEFDHIVLGSGTSEEYFQDDMEIPFRTNGHFAHWCPATGPNHHVVISRGDQPGLYYFFPQDYWLEFTSAEGEYWAGAFKLKTLHSTKDIWSELGKLKKVAYVGDDFSAAKKAGFELLPKEIVCQLDWNRRAKSEYEIAMTEKATELAANGHKLAVDLFKQGASEKEIYFRYQQESNSTVFNMGYDPIVAINEKGAVLHYHSWRDEKVKNDVLLIDAGAKHQFYNSDITRTHISKDVPGEFKKMLQSLEAVQLKLCDLVVKGYSYVDLQKQATLLIGEILIDAGVIKQKTTEEAFASGATKVFYPHGIGHLIGVFVHDVSGKQGDPKGTFELPAEEFPTLRFRNGLDEGYLVTVEPGIYFNKVLIDRARPKLSNEVDWALVDKLMPFGGMRIEDDVLVTATGNRNITREYLPRGYQEV